jgi:hypothetical protein
MSWEHLQRITWRLRERFPIQNKITNNDLRKVIDEEVGTDDRTYHRYRKALVRHGMIRAHKTKWVLLMDRKKPEDNTPCGMSGYDQRRPDDDIDGDDDNQNPKLTWVDSIH